MTDDDRREPHEPTFTHDVGNKEQRKMRARRDEDRSVWFWLGMMGLVGWSVAVPTIIGVAIGAWLDTWASVGRISWTLTGVILGITVGCITAWFWVKRESEHH
ncbi:MAG: AtpZ/AtpI family protein [Planctomycetota bacterium]